MIERDECQGPVYFQKWYGMKPTTPIISGGMNALRLPGFFENLGHGNVINTSGGGSYGHIDSPAAGAISLRQSYECWKSGADPIEYAKSTRNSPARSNPSPATPTSCIPAGVKSWACTSKPRQCDAELQETPPARWGRFSSAEHASDRNRFSWRRIRQRSELRNSRD